MYPTRKPQPLPDILSVDEVKAILSVSQNLKHRTMLTLIYALGLRSGELIRLKIADIDGKRQVVHLKGTKGNKDRLLPLSEKLRDVLRIYYQKYRPKEYLFNGQKSATYSPQSLRKVFATACRKANIRKKVTLHSLRHAYATHLLEAGTDVRVIQQLLGHNSIRTTMIYTHVTTHNLMKVPSPLDFLDE